MSIISDLVNVEEFDKIKNLHSVKIIGHITTKQDGYLITGDDGSEVELSAQGWRDISK